VGEVNLEEIEAKANNVADSLMIAGRGEAELLALRLQGLKNLAQIKSTVAFRKERENQPLLSYPTAPLPAICGVQSPQIWAGERYVSQTCRVQAGHAGLHRSAQGAEWSEGVSAEPTKPAVDRLHELVSYIREGQKDAPFASAEEVLDIADKLEEILREGSL
jgi:hypothetical protein